MAAASGGALADFPDLHDLIAAKGAAMVARVKAQQAEDAEVLHALVA